MQNALATITFVFCLIGFNFVELHVVRRGLEEY